MKELKRIQVGDFKIDDSITVEELEANTNNRQFINEQFITIEKIFEKSESIKLENKKLELFLNGVRLTQEKQNGVYKIYNENNEFIGIGVIDNKLLKRDIILT